MTLEYVLKQTILFRRRCASGYFDTVCAYGGAFLSGLGDFVTLFEPIASTLEREGTGHIVASIGAESGEIPYTAYYAKKSYIEKNPEIIQAFTNAVYKGQRWVENHSENEVAEALKDAFPDNDQQLLETVVKRYREQDAWNKTPVMKEEALLRLQDVMKDAENKGYPPFEKIVNNTFAEKGKIIIKPGKMFLTVCHYIADMKLVCIGTQKLYTKKQDLV